jgi:predicted N-formylglutamate amidohydrolase
MSARRAAPLPASKVSRLACDGKRPPEAPEPMPALREVCENPGNNNFTGKQKAKRISRNYRPIETRVQQTRATKPDPTLAMMHSSTPAFHGIRRGVESGLLHDKDRRRADAMLRCARNHCVPEIRRNGPCGPDDGVTYTLQRYAIARGRPNIMSETSNARISTRDTRIDTAAMMSVRITEAVSQSGNAA